MFVKNPNLGADPNLGDFTVYIIHSVSDQQVKKIQTITILADNKTKFRNIEKL